MPECRSSVDYCWACYRAIDNSRRTGHDRVMVMASRRLLVMVPALLLFACTDSRGDSDDEVAATDTGSGSGEDEIEGSGSESASSSSDNDASSSDTDASTDVDTSDFSESDSTFDASSDSTSDTSDSTSDTNDTSDTGSDSGSDSSDSSDSGTTGDPVQPYLVHVRNDTDELVKIDVVTGVETFICAFGANVAYPSITFGIDGVLYGSRMGQFLDIIDPCTCGVTPVGDMGYTAINGITANGLEILRLYGISANADVLLEVSTIDASSTVVGAGLGIDFGNHGSTWSTDILGLYAINANNDWLYEIDIGSGQAIAVAQLDVPFTTVGIEWHPDTGIVYACTDGHLYEVDPETGTTTEIGNMGHPCTNLAAPWPPVPCVDDL
jgi:hypothetical protein